jgi:tetratricopeptide (TPR) repeat protein
VLNRLIRDFRRSALFHVLAIFLASGWAVLQIIDALIDNGVLPAWTFKGGLVVLLLGLPVVLATAYVQGMRASEERRTATAVDPRSSDADVAGPATTASPAPAAVAQHVFTWRNAILGGVAAFALLGMASGAWMAMRVLGIGAVGTLAAQGVLERGAAVVLADVQSGDDAELGDVVTRTLRVDLIQSPMVRVLDRNELNAPLARMHAEPGARITGDVATQLAERDGYAAVITGDVARAGSGYVRTASTRASEGFLPMAAFHETARSDDDLIGAIERLSRAIRDRAGESLRTVQGGASLERVTTSSLPALREYTRGEAILETGDWAAGLVHFERAVALDSTFAMAHRRIAAALSNLRIRRADVARALRRTYELRDRLPDLECYLAIGSYHDRLDGDLAAAARAYEQALAIDSAHASAHNSLANIYTLQGRHEEAARHYAAPLRTRPIAPLFGNLARSRYRTPTSRAQWQASIPPSPGCRRGATVISSKPCWRQHSTTFTPPIRSPTCSSRRPATPVSAKTAICCGTSSRPYAVVLREAEHVLDGPTELSLNDPVHRAAWRAELRLLKGDTAKAVDLVQHALSGNAGAIDDAALVDAIIALIHARAADEAAAALNGWKAATPDEHIGAWGWMNRDLLTASLQRVRGDFAGSLATLQALRRRCPGCASSVDYAIAQTHDDMEQADAAFAAYEQALAAMAPVTLMDDAHEIPHALRRLGELYDAQGNTAKAIEYYARFVNLWRDADPELQPLVRRAQGRLNALRPDRG